MAKREGKRTETGGTGKTGLEHLEFRFKESNTFRVVPVDGAWGGVRKDLKFHISFYVDRPALPTASELELDAENLTAKQKVTLEDYIVREVQFTTLMDFAVARSLRNWLDQHVQRIESEIGEQEDDTSGTDLS